MKTGPCEYCGRPGPMRLEEGKDSDRDAYVCEIHWTLLSNPVTALPLIRGTVTSNLRGLGPPSSVGRVVNGFISRLERLTTRK